MSDDGNLPALVNLPSVIDEEMKNARQFKHVLASTEKVNEYTRLVPSDMCRAIIPEIERRIIPMDNDTATKKAYILLGCYPPAQTNKLANETVYVRGIIAAFEEVPKDIADLAIQHISGEMQWLPTRAEVRRVCQQMLNERKRMLWNAKAHLAEHDRRALPKPAEKRYSDFTDEEKAAHEARMEAVRRALAGATAGLRTTDAEPNEERRKDSLSRAAEDGEDAEGEEAT